MGMLPITTSTSDKLFSCINIDNFERPWASNIRGFYWFLQSLAAAHTPRMNCDERAGDTPTVCEQELVYAFARLVSISSNFLFRITLAKIRTSSWLFQNPCPISGLFRISGNPATNTFTENYWKNANSNFKKNTECHKHTQILQHYKKIPIHVVLTCKLTTSDKSWFINNALHRSVPRLLES